MRAFTSAPSTEKPGRLCVVSPEHTWPSDHNTHEGYATIVLLLWHGNRGHAEMPVRGRGALVCGGIPRDMR